MQGLELSEINLYPVKSCGGYSVPRVTLDRFGPSGDRRWMIVDPQGQFLSQRDHPQMALVQARLDGANVLSLVHGEAQLQLAAPTASGARRQVQVWGDEVSALDAGDTAASWLSDRLQRACRLVYMPAESRRLVDTAYAADGQTVGFADAFPLLLISRASLDELNRRLPSPVPMNRFRPNLVVSGARPFAEDSWRRLRIGGLELAVVKPCARCVIPSIDQATARRDPTINRVLADFRRIDRQIMFGQNLLYSSFGELAVGQPVELLG